MQAIQKCINKLIEARSLTGVPVLAFVQITDVILQLETLLEQASEEGHKTCCGSARRDVCPQALAASEDEDA
jgi:hypothetical protein